MFEVWNMKWVLEWPLLTIFKVPKRFRNSPGCAQIFVMFHRGKLAHCDLTVNHNYHSSSHLCNLIQKDNYVYKDKAVKGVDWWRGRLTWPPPPSVHCISFHHQQFIRLLLFLNNVQRYIGNISLFFRIWNGKWMFHSQPGNLSQSNMAFNLWLVSIHDDLLQALRVKNQHFKSRHIGHSDEPC